MQGNSVEKLICWPQCPSAEERRHLKIIANGFGEKPALKLMFGAMIRAAERWRATNLALWLHADSDATRA